MPATLYLRHSPRAYFLLTETHALVFRQPDASETKASRSVVVAEFLPLEEVDVGGLVKASKERYISGVLGMTSVPTERSPVPEIFLLLVSASSPLPPLLPQSSLRPSRVLSVEFHCLSSNFWDSPDLAPTPGFGEDLSDDDYGGPSNYHSTASSTQSQAAQQGVENPTSGMRKYLESGGFFYAEGVKWDISTRMGEINWIQAEKNFDSVPHPLETFDERFVWNASLLRPLLDFRAGLPARDREVLDEQSLIVPVIQGFCGSSPISTGSWSDGRPEQASLSMISRLSWKRAGARFRTRGIDDDGQVANFVETELILALESVTMSYVQIRGSVPLFWQQPQAGLGTLQQKVEITRPPQASQPAFDKHFIDLLDHYHSVHAVNLLGQRDAEAMLSAAYSEHLDSLKRTLQRTPRTEKEGLHATNESTVSLTPYDFHASVKTGGTEGVKYDFSTRLAEVVRSMQDYGWTAVDTSTGQIIESQTGIFRTNCLDCLDRTNFVQDVIASITLTRFLESIGSPLADSPTLWSAHRILWADNGDRLSKINAGTGALNSSATRSGKKSFAGLLSDATKSVGRAYINNFQDKGKQTAIDMLLGMMAGQRPVILFDPISDSVQSALAARINEYSRTRSISLFCGTWNLNGKAPDEALDAWLFPPESPEADIYAIAFQEIVELTPGQILQTDPAKRRMWEKYIVDTFAMRNTKSEYILYRSEQLVGTALIIVVRAELSKYIRRVESATKKTGLQGLSGNKGGVGIRLDLHDSSICFMTCHLAAGHGNVAERNADYRTISNGLKFQRGKMIDDHDIVVWFADFNYRISMANIDVRQYAEGGHLDMLLGADQLLQAMDNGEVFEGYDEGPITFKPTYKYDNGFDVYDTSEKARIPAWTDRVIFKGAALRLKEYDRAELRTSDHRPVYAFFDATIRQVDQPRKDAIAKELLHTVRSEMGSGGLDNKIEKASNGGISGIVQGLTHASIRSPVSASPPRRSHVPAAQSPRLPPRPSGSTDSLKALASGPKLPPRPPHTQVGSPTKPTTTLTTVSRRAAPPIHGQVPSPASLTSLAPPSPGKRSAPPIPTSRSRANSNRLVSPLQTVSPTLTPASTGDYMLVTSPTAPSQPTASTSALRSAPQLPPRYVMDKPSQQSSSVTKGDGPALLPPRSRPSLDLNGSPPKGLVSPVSPDTPSVKETKKAHPPVPTKPGDSTSITNNVDKKPVPPMIPRKPVALRSASGTT